MDISDLDLGHIFVCEETSLEFFNLLQDFFARKKEAVRGCQERKDAVLLLLVIENL